MTELIARQEIEYLLGFGTPRELRSALTLVEAGPEGLPTRIDPGPEYPPSESPFCAFLRHGKLEGKLAFAGANRECERCEARLANRALTSGEISHSRCHLGLTDFAVPVVVRGRIVAAIVAGQCVEEDDQRKRITKTVGKIGKLTRGEVRSLEESGDRVAPAIQVADEQARERLLREIPEIPRAPADFQARLGQVASMLGRLGSDRVPSLRRDWEDELVDSLLPDFPALPVREPECLLWLRTALFELRRRLGVEFIAVFAPGPERLDEAAAFLPLAAENGLSGDAGTRDAGTDAPETGKPLLELHPRRLLKSLGESAPVALGLHAVSRLIGALRASDASPPGWKDRLTKAIFVAPVTPLRGLEMVFVYGAPTGDVRPEDDDLDVLWRAAGRIANQYLIVLSENGRQVAAEQVRKLAKVDEPKRKPSPIRPQRFDIVRLIGACVDKQRELASGRDVSFDVRGLPERLMVEADRNKLHSVVDVVLHYASRSARSEDASGGASILVGCRRDKRSRGRVNVTVDMLGDFLSGDEQRALLRSETPPEAAPAPPASEADEPTGGEPTGGNGSAEDADSQVRAASAETRGDGGKESGTERDGGKPDRGFISFKEAQRYLSWHGGRLALECVRTREVASRWLGRTVFTLSFREVRREQSEPARSERSEPARSEPARHEKSRPESRGG